MIHNSYRSQVITFQCMADLFLGSIIIMLRWFSQKGEVRLGRERREKGWERKAARATNCAGDYGTAAL